MENSPQKKFQRTEREGSKSALCMYEVPNKNNETLRTTYNISINRG